jgi:hypothetical protein
MRRTNEAVQSNRLTTQRKPNNLQLREKGVQFRELCFARAVRSRAGMWMI